MNPEETRANQIAHMLAVMQKFWGEVEGLSPDEMRHGLKADGQ